MTTLSCIITYVCASCIFLRLCGPAVVPVGCRALVNRLFRSARHPTNSGHPSLLLMRVTADATAAYDSGTVPATAHAAIVAASLSYDAPSHHEIVIHLLHFSPSMLFHSSGFWCCGFLTCLTRPAFRASTIGQPAPGRTPSFHCRRHLHQTLCQCNQFLRHFLRRRRGRDTSVHVICISVAVGDTILIRQKHGLFSRGQRAHTSGTATWQVRSCTS